MSGSVGDNIFRASGVIASAAAGGGFTSTSPVGRQTITGGRAVIGGFAPDTKVHFTTRIRNHVEETTVCELSTQPQQSFEVLAGDLRPSLIMVLVDPSGKPIPRVRLSTEIKYDGLVEEEGAAREAGPEAPDPALFEEFLERLAAVPLNG